MTRLIVAGVDFRIQGKSGVFAGFVYFENPNDENDCPRLTFDNVDGVQKSFNDGTPVSPEYVKMAEEALTQALKETGRVLAPADAND